MSTVRLFFKAGSGATSRDKVRPLFSDRGEHLVNAAMGRLASDSRSQS
jgi:hypothetical protein